jgi:inner membrane transporter RhtA
VARTSPGWTSAPAVAAVLVVLGLACQDLGASFAVLIFPQVGALGMVALRLVFSAIVLLAIARPRLAGRSTRDWLVVVGFGLAIAVMNGAFYLALDRIPLGITVTIEVLGPLTLSVIAGRKPLAFVWAGLAVVGVVLLGGVDLSRLEVAGVLFALLAAGCWIAYILASAETGRRFPRLDGLALAMTVGAIVSLPFGIATAGPALVQPNILLVGFAVAIMSSTIPYGLELFALRRITEGTFGVLMSLSPALAATAGLVVLHQGLHPLDLLAIALVIAASMGAVLTAPRRSTAGGHGPVEEPVA